MFLDLIEEFRQPIIDRAMITLLQKKIIDEGDIEKALQGFKMALRIEKAIFNQKK